MLTGHLTIQVVDRGPEMDNSTTALLERIRQFAMPYGPPQCRQVFLRQIGEMRMGPDKPWVPFKAEQTLDATGLDFLWQARLRMFRVVPTTILDTFAGEHGSLSVRLFGMFPIARFRGAAVDKGEAMRGLAEMPLRPFGFMQQPRLNWAMNDDGGLRASYNNDQISASVEFELDSEGRPSTVFASDRPRVVGRSTIETPWSGVFGAWKFFGKVRIPAFAEVAWHLPEGAFTCWRGQITDFTLITG